MASRKKSPSSYARRQVLAEWRGIAEEPDLTRNEHNFSLVLEKFLREAGFENRCSEEDLAPVWEAAVGTFAAQNSKALAYENGILFVAVLQPSVHFTLQRELKSRILPKLKSALPGRPIRDVRFRLG